LPCSDQQLVQHVIENDARETGADRCMNYQYMQRNTGFSRRDFLKSGLVGVLGADYAFDGMREQFASFNNNETLYFFDCYTKIGPDKVIHPANRWRLEELVTEMDYCSISAALVAYTLSSTYDPHHSNLELSRMLAPYPNLYAIWNVMPHASGEFPDPRKLDQLVKEHNVRALSIQPLSNSWDWRTHASKELFDWISASKMLVSVQASELGRWSDVEEFLTRFPEVPLLLNRISYGEQRFVIPLLDKYKNLHVCFDTFQINEGIEYFVEKGLEDQLLFGSSAPAMSVGAHRTFVDLSRVSLPVKRKIAGGNLKRLLKLESLPPQKHNKEEDYLMKSIRQGTPPPTPILDMHMHILDTGVFGVGRHYRMRNGDPKGVFEAVRTIGYQGGGIMSWNGIQSYVSTAGNETTKNALDLSPGGFWGLGTFDPSHYSQSEIQEQIQRVYADKRFIGMKPYPFFGIEYHDKRFDIWWEFGNENQLYALIHHSRSDLKEVDTLAARYPNIRWVIAHTGSNYHTADMAIEMMKKHSNVFAEITFTSVTGGIIERMVNEVGDNRVVYGSDLPMRDPRQQLGWVVFANLPVRAKEKILAYNGAEIIRPCLKRLPDFSVPAFLKKGKS
jgi:predicted TIM-barrel fold metal-dependent hydrolase